MIKQLNIEELEKIFSSLQTQLDNIDEGIIEESLSKFDYSSWNINFYSNQISILNKSDSENDCFYLDFNNTILSTIEERIETLKTLTMQLLLSCSTFKKDEYLSSNDNISNRCRDLHEIVREKKIQTI